MTSTEKAIRDFCGHHADWWPSTTQVQEMLALAQPCSTCEENKRLKKEIANQDAMLERQTARIVDLQTHSENFEGEL